MRDGQKMYYLKITGNFDVKSVRNRVFERNYEERSECTFGSYQERLS